MFSNLLGNSSHCTSLLLATGGGLGSGGSTKKSLSKETIDLNPWNEAIALRNQRILQQERESEEEKKYDDEKESALREEVLQERKWRRGKSHGAEVTSRNSNRRIHYYWVPPRPSPMISFLMSTQTPPSMTPSMCLPPSCATRWQRPDRVSKWGSRAVMITGAYMSPVTASKKGRFHMLHIRNITTLLWHE